MRWQIYLQQSQAMGVIALAMLILEFGIFSAWFMIQISKLPVIVKYRSCLTIGFWCFCTALYLGFFGWLCFGWPG